MQDTSANVHKYIEQTRSAFFGALTSVGALFYINFRRKGKMTMQVFLLLIGIIASVAIAAIIAKIQVNKKTTKAPNTSYALQQSTVTFPPKTTNSQAASQKPAGTSVQNQATPKAVKDAEKKFFTMFAKFFLLIGVGGAVLISLVSMALYGKIYMFDGEAFTAALWIVCFLFIAIGMVGVVGATGKEKFAMTIAIAIIGIVVLCVLFAVGNFFSSIFSGVFGGDDEWDTCHKCGGDGRVENSLGIEVECPQCDGVGFIP